MMFSDFIHRFYNKCYTFNLLLLYSQQQFIPIYQPAQSDMSKKIRLKIAIIGPPGSGKTSFITNLIEKPFNPSYTKTEGYELSIYNFSKDRIEYQIQLWECGCQHKDYNKHIRQAFFKNCSAAFLMFDLTNRKWKDKIEEWLAEAYEFDCFLVYAIGTKKDLFARQKYSEKFGNQTIPDRLSDSLLESEGVETLDELDINKFFEQFQVKHFYQSANEPVYKSIRNIFISIENDQQKLTRSSLAVGRRFDNTQIELGGNKEGRNFGRGQVMTPDSKDLTLSMLASVKMQEIEEENGKEPKQQEAN